MQETSKMKLEVAGKLVRECFRPVTHVRKYTQAHGDTDGQPEIIMPPVASIG